TILHAEHHRPAELPMPDRYARHYADMARLLQHPQADAMLADHALCARVVAWKSRVFARQWARYDLALPSSFRLVPPPSRNAELARDYAEMRPMFLTEPPSFDTVLSQLASAEHMLNQRGA
ncbi:MAG: nucleotidyl transferase AbiEii/AbiGii toxin family protein, partial [Rhizobacter sp.]